MIEYLRAGAVEAEEGELSKERGVARVEEGAQEQGQLLTDFGMNSYCIAGGFRTGCVRLEKAR